MMLAKKTTAFTITFILIFSMFSYLICPIKPKAEQTPDEISEIIELFSSLIGDIDFKNILTPHPYRFVGVWESNGTRTISGDMDFKLYFSSNIINEINPLGFEDKVNVSVYHTSGGKPVLKGEKNDIDIDLKEGILNDKVQSMNVKIKDINVSINKGDYLLFGIEMNQSRKWISKLTENRYEKAIQPRLEKFARWLKDRDDPNLRQIGNITSLFLENLTAFGVGGEEFSYLINALRSSSFYYGSKQYKSNVKFSSEENENFTIFFRNEGDFSFETNFLGESIFSYISDISGTPYFKIANNTAPTTGTKHAWPPFVGSVEDVFQNLQDTIGNFEDTSGNFTQDYNDPINWLVIFLVYYFESVPEIPENQVNLYLKDNELSTGKPSEDTKRKKLSENTSSTWVSTPIPRNRIIKNLSAELYIHYPKLITFSNLEVKASILDENEGITIAEDTQTLDRTTFYELRTRGPESPTVFNFDIKDGGYEIFYDHNLSLNVVISNAPLINLRPVNLLYNSEQYPSHITYVFDETDNIKIEDVEDKKIYAGGSAKFEFNVSSNYSDTLKIDILERDNQGTQWNVEYSPETMECEEKSTTQVTVYINSTATDDSVYGNYYSFYLNVSGNTGIDSKSALVTIDMEAVEYDFELILPDTLQMKHGEEKTITLGIKNKNKGHIQDDYTVEIASKNEFKTEFLNESYVTNVPVYEQDSDITKIKLNVSIPWYTDVNKDKLTFNVTSTKSVNYQKDLIKTVVVTVNITNPNIVESIYHLFEILSQKIGLSNYTSYGAWILIGILALILLIIITIAVILIRRKYAKLTCKEQIKEIYSDETAVYEIIIRNPYKRTLTYDIEFEADEDTKDRWKIDLEKTKVTLGPNKKDTIRLTVKPTDYVKQEDFAEVKINIKPILKRKISSITTVTVLKDSKIDISISGVIHWPKRFKKGDVVETSFKLFNKGKVSADNLTIVLYVNGEEKNKVEEVTIPIGGYADIEIPWIAEKGKNEIKIIVK